MTKLQTGLKYFSPTLVCTVRRTRRTALENQRITLTYIYREYCTTKRTVLFPPSSSHIRRFRGTAPACLFPQIVSLSISFWNLENSAAAKSWYGFFSVADRECHSWPSSFVSSRTLETPPSPRLALRK